MLRSTALAVLIASGLAAHHPAHAGAPAGLLDVHHLSISISPDLDRGPAAAAALALVDPASVTSYLNVRNAPAGDIIGKLQPGTPLRVLGRVGNWAVISYGGGPAYVWAGYLAPAGATPGPVSAGVPISPRSTRERAFPFRARVDPRKVQTHAVVHHGPGTSEIGRLTPGQATTVMARQGGWAIIQFNDKKAFVRLDILEPIE
jgi:hypothetical protein